MTVKTTGGSPDAPSTVRSPVCSPVCSPHAPGEAYTCYGVAIPARHPSHDLPDEQLRKVEALDAMEHAAMYPFARMTDLQRHTYRMEGFNECMKAVLLAYREGYNGQEYLDAILLDAGAANDELTDAIERAKAGIL